MTSAGTQGAAESEGSPVCCGTRVWSKKDCPNVLGLQVCKSESHEKSEIQISVFNLTEKCLYDLPDGQ